MDHRKNDNNANTLIYNRIHQSSRKLVNYCPYYCEENIWHLCKSFITQQSSVYVLFISNRDRQVAFWLQRQAPNNIMPIIWDYHVVLLSNQQQSWFVWDLDSKLPIPCNLRFYIQTTFPIILDDYPSFQPAFRIISGETFLTYFASDRRHMRTADGWIHPPPDWPTIGMNHNLDQFIDMNDTFFGEIVEKQKLLELFSDTVILN